MEHHSTHIATLRTAAVIVAVMLVSAAMWALFYDPVPDFHKMSNVDTKKAVFFDFLKPAVISANDQIRRQRRSLLAAGERMVTGSASVDDWRVVAVLAAEYEVEVADPPAASDVQRLLRRVDTIPLSLVVAQAAKESGWGASRFAQNYNNFFGVWCYQAGCGVVPRQRAAGQHHEVADFSSVAASVEYYLKNLNTHAAYRELRTIRQQLRAQGKWPNGELLAQGLTSYSERGAAYVEEIVGMIRYNRLDQL